MSKAPRHQGPQLRLCCGLLTSCPTQKGSARSLRKTLVGCSPRCRCPHICVGGRTNRPCEPPNGYKRSTSKTNRVASSRRLILAAGSGAGARWDLGLPAAALYRLKAPHEEGRLQPVAGISGFSMAASVNAVLEGDQRRLPPRSQDGLIRAAGFEIE